jgi:hypothetical protein
MTPTITTTDGNAYVFVALEHASSEIVGIHAAGSVNRLEALEAPSSPGVCASLLRKLAGRAACVSNAYSSASRSTSGCHPKSRKAMIGSLNKRSRLSHNRAAPIISQGKPRRQTIGH